MPRGTTFARPIVIAITALLALLAAWLPPADGAEAPAKPDGFPDRPLTIIVPYAEGGESDLLSRALAAALETVIGAKVLVTDKPGESGMAAVPEFMAAPADGYTLLESMEEAAANHAAGKLKENPAVDWWPLGMVQVTFSQIYIRPGDVRFSDWQSFAAYARTSPGDVKIANVASPGAMERVNLFKLEQLLGLKINQIGFDNPVERYAALIGGAVDALFEQPGDVASFLESGKMKPILTLYPERPLAYEKVPTLADIGVDLDPLLRYRGFWVLPAVPEARRRYLEWAVHTAWQSDAFQAFNRQRSMDLIASYRSHEEAKAMLEKSIDAYGRIYREMGLIQ
ncbi:MAG TPA: tripartite tricarboxylate transporter substrate-binding protein [Kiloniellales bacterium]